MQISNPDEAVGVPSESDDCRRTRPDNIEEELEESTNVESAIDVSGKTYDLHVLDDRIVNRDENVEGLYLYKNTFNLIPRSVGGLGKLKTLKFFGNEVKLFPSEFENLVNLERLQVKISLPGLTGLPLPKLKALRELELSKVPPRPSAFPLLGDIMGLEHLTKLSVCHFSIRYLPPEIGCLSCLEYLDLSHNKMRSLPTEISHLTALITLKVANNKLVKIPSSLSSLQRLEKLDLSSNRLTSLGSLELDSMHNLRKLNLQHNKLLFFPQIPQWVSCDIEGNDEDMSNDEFISSSVEMDVLESTAADLHDETINGSPSSSNHLTGSSSSNRCFAARKPRKGWKRHYYLQRRARQERLNCSRKWKSEDSANISTQKSTENCEPCNAVIPCDSLVEASSVTIGHDLNNKELLVAEGESGISLANAEKDLSSEKVRTDSCACILLESVEVCKEGGDDCTQNGAALGSLSDAAKTQEESLLLDNSSGGTQSKRHSERDLDNPKPRKSRRSTDRHLDLSSKYSTISFCSVDDHLADGFYDAGRDRPFLSLNSYEKNVHLGSREVVLMDRAKDEELDAITLSAQALLFHLNQIYDSSKEGRPVSLDNLQIASLLALFVSDHFGGSDKSAMVDRARKSVSGSNYSKPFVCTCPTGNSDTIMKSAKQSVNSAEDAVLLNLCEKSLQSVKARRNSIIIPIGTLQFGVCRHRALLMKYLCDRMEPQVPCELVRGYLDFSPHAWNVIVVERGDSRVRIVVDACRPHDVREETDPEYFCRYIPLSRINDPPITDGSSGVPCSFPTLSACEEIRETGCTTLIQCDFGSIEAAAKVRTLKVSGICADEVKNFEFNCLGEVRLLSAFKHPCIVKILGHQISTKWLLSEDGVPEHRILQSSIFMEYVKGGSLKQYVEKLARSGEKHAPVELTLQIVRDVACALSELHSKDVMHRDIKSENILIDLDTKKSDGTPVVKLCDFDRAVPLRSCLHTCCIGHIGIPPPDVCVGTPRWMAPEVFRTIHERRLYGLEADIWSFGCLLLELLTLQVPYSGLAESEIHDLLLRGKRPTLTEELEAFGGAEDSESQSQSETRDESLRFLVDVYRQCTVDVPSDRPTAEKLCRMLADFSNSQVSQNLSCA